MKWPWQRDDSDPLDTDSGQALADAEERLAEIQDQWPQVHRLSSTLREYQRRNHFGDSVARLMRGDG